MWMNGIHSKDIYKINGNKIPCGYEKCSDSRLSSFRIACQVFIELENFNFSWAL